MQKVEIYRSNSFNPHYNLAIESALMDEVKEGTLILYLWANDNTVVIGRYQNAYKDVNVKKLYEDNGILARRQTGGGAVFHDKGNLNFSFISDRKDYDVNAQNDIIIGAMKRLNFNAEVNGRNDLVIDNRKFSGNAYLKRGESALHHGTILISADTNRMQEYLNVSPDKLEGKGVSSVRSRVVNLQEISKNIVINDVISALIAECQSKFTNVEMKNVGDIDKDVLDKYYKFFSDEEYILGRSVELKSHRYKRFSWGYADVSFTITAGVIEDIEICTDSLLLDEIELAKRELIGKSIFENNRMSDIAKDILTLINDM